MIDLRSCRIAAWIAMAALALPSVAGAQQADAPASKPKKTTAKPAPSGTADVFGVSAAKSKPTEEKIDVDSVFGKLKELKSAD